MAEQLGAHLDRVARPGDALGPGVQDAADVAEPRGRLTAQAVGIDARHLRGDVGANAHQPTGELVGELEGLHIQVVPGAGEQRVQVFDEGGITSS